MATDSSTIDGGPGSLNLTPEEKRVFGQLFRQADTEGIGVVTGEVAVKFFEKTKLEPWILGEIWQIADKENRGLLTPAGFGIVLRLIGHYQAGQNPTPELAFKPGPLPRFDGITVAGTIAPPPPGPPPGALRPQVSGGPIRVPPLTPEKVNQYAALFEKSGAQGGVLAGEQAKQIFEKAGLPNEILGRIWNLADTEQRGALVLPEFIIAMHLIASFKSGSMQVLPSILPAGLYEAATRRVPTRQMSGASPGPSQIPAIGKQFSGTNAGRAGSPLARSAYSAPSQPSVPPSQANDWAVTPVEKAQFDSLYSTLDKTNRGFITGDEAVPFFSNSKLPEEVLASIWDLADIQSQGHLTRDEFAVAMYLIRQQRNKRDGRDTLPTTLPTNLIPPSIRKQVRPAAQSSAATFNPSAPVMAKSAADDLFGLDAFSTDSSAPTQAPMSTGGSTGFGDPFGNTRTPLTPTSPTQGSSSLQSSTSFKPFIPSSSFGQTLTQNATGGSTASGPLPQPRSAPSAMDDLLGDNDPEVSKKLTNETTELANLSNHVSTLSKQMQEVQSQRSTSQSELNQASTQKREFELRLSQLRSLYDQEVKDVKSLQERLTASRNEAKRLQQDTAMVEGTYQDLQTQHREIVTALQADQQENAILKERMRVVNAEITEMKPQLEKLRSEARQQKGLVAINKKQLATNEGERDKLNLEAEELTRSNEQARAIAVSSQAQSPAAIASPALSTMSGNNPFFRRQTSISSDGASASLARSPAAQQTDRSFDNIFGPPFSQSAITENSTPPATFNQEAEASHNVPSQAVKVSLPTHPSESGELSNLPTSQPTMSSREISEQIEPPAPSESRQISSSFLPFSPERMDSLSSSRQVSAPTSRYGENSTAGPDTPTSYTATTPTGLPAAGQAEAAAGTTLQLDRNGPASPVVSEARSTTNVHGSIPGAFPGDPGFHVTATSTGGSTFSDSKEAFPLSKDLPRTPTATKDDFDAAFAGFGGSGVAKDRQASSSSNDSAPKTTGAFNKEFPPLKELEQDDDSEDSDEHGGFDDDFTPVSPRHSRKETSTQSQSSPLPTIVANDGADSPSQSRPAISHNASAVSMGGDPPTATAQSSPPAYDKAVSPQDKAQAEISQYSGLLPAREDPTLSPHPHTKEQALSSPAMTGGQALFGNIPNITSNLPPPPAKVPFDDFDNDFDDLEDAKEGDMDDDFAHISALDRSGTLDFDPTFDSPAASKTSQHTAQGSSGFGGESNGFGDFTQSPVKSTAAQPAVLSTGMSTADSHDWDAIFAGLDQPSATNDAFEVKNTAAPAKTNGTNINAATVRPAFGRALTEAGEHDYPILKELTEMGYTRKDALSALEKYDYNLERAANYLASQ